MGRAGPRTKERLLAEYGRLGRALLCLAILALILPGVSLVSCRPRDAGASGDRTVAPAVVAPSPPAAAPASVEVRFAFRGTERVVSGQMLDDSTWLFNPGAPRRVRLATLDWPPYIGPNLCNLGWVMQLAVAVLASRDYEIEVTLYPWSRAVRLTETGEYDVLFPEYYIDPETPSEAVSGARRLGQLALSRPFPGGPVAFIKRRDYPLKFDGALEALRGEKIGVVQGYLNTPEFDRLAAQGTFDLSLAVDDFQNAQKLFYGRVNLIVGDPAVIFWTIRNSAVDDAVKAAMLENLEVVSPELAYNYLYFAVSRARHTDATGATSSSVNASGNDPGTGPGSAVAGATLAPWELLLSDLDSALLEFELSGELWRIIQRASAECGQPEPLPPPVR